MTELSLAEILQAHLDQETEILHNALDTIQRLSDSTLELSALEHRKQIAINQFKVGIIERELEKRQKRKLSGRGN